MCACEPGYVCSRCAGTPFDDRWQDDQPPIPPAEFDTYIDRGIEPPMVYPREWL